MQEVDPDLGFHPAFLDIETCSIHIGSVVAGKATLVPGFERNGFFYTRSAAARATAEWTGMRRAHVSLRSH